SCVVLSVIESRLDVTFLNFAFFVRVTLSVVPREQRTSGTRVVTPVVGSVTLTFTVAHVVMSACPPGLPSARAQTVHVVETSTGSWKSAPLLSVALASSTRKLSLRGAGSKEILLNLLRF